MKVGNKAWWGAASVATAGTLTFVLVGNNAATPVAPGGQAAEPQHPAAVTTLVAADPEPAAARTAVTVSGDSAKVSAEHGTGSRLLTTSADPAPAGPAVIVSGDSAKVSAEDGIQAPPLTTSAEMLERAQALREADRTVTRSQGPAEACLDQMKVIVCPIIGNMPFIRDVAGQIAIWGNFECPTGTLPQG
jgi:hypothetical protein